MRPTLLLNTYPENVVLTEGGGGRWVKGLLIPASKLLELLKHGMMFADESLHRPEHLYDLLTASFSLNSEENFC